MVSEYKYLVRWTAQYKKDVKLAKRKVRGVMALVKKCNKLLFLCLLLSSRMVFAENNLRTLFDFKEYPSKEIVITDRGTFESQYIKDTDYSVCWGFSVEGLKGIDRFLYYPSECNKVNKFTTGKIEINNQEFAFKFFNWEFLVPFLTLRSVHFEGRTFLLLLGGFSKYYDKVCFMFDITNPDRIVFYPPENRFVEADLRDAFFGLYQNKFCFFFSEQRFDWNGQYRLSPYVAEGGSLKALRDKNGNPYFVDYAYTEGYKRGFVIEGKNVPK